MERRAIASQLSQTRPNTIRGYAATYGTPTMIRDAMGREFRESIAPGAFDRSLVEQPDIRLLRDHDPARLIARTKSGTLSVGSDARGLWFEAELPDTQDGRDMAASIRRGDLDACSFGFQVVADHWGEDDGMPVRELRDLTLWECSVVAFPAYSEGTEVNLRSIDQLAQRRARTAAAKERLAVAKNKR